MPSSHLTALLALALLGAGPTGCTGADNPPPEAPGATSTTEGQAFMQLLYRGRTPAPTHPIAGDPAGTWHYSVDFDDGGRPVAWRRVTPSGTVEGSSRVDWGGEISRKTTFRDAYGVLDRTEQMSAAGDLAVTYRSGVRTEDGCTTLKHRWNAQGRPSEVRCLDPEGALVINIRGCPIEEHRWSDDGVRLARSCHDETGAATLDRWGVHESRWLRDGQGRRLAQSWFDPSGAPTVHGKLGCERLAWEHDRAGNEFQERCEDSAGTPARVRGGTWSRIASTYDRNGCEVSRTWRDEAGLPTVNSEVARVLWRRDAACGVLSWAQYDLSGAPATNQPKRPWAWTQELNAEGLVVRRWCRGDDDRRVTCLFCETEGEFDGGSVYTYEYDGRGRELCKRAWFHNGEPARVSYSYPHADCTTWGPDGRRATQYFMESDGTPARALGVHRMEYEHDVLGYQVRERYVDESGQPLNSAIGCAGFTDLYDARQRHLGRECLDVDGGLRGTDGEMHQAGVSWPDGTARVIVQRAADQRVIANLFFDEQGRVRERRSCERPTEPCYRW